MREFKFRAWYKPTKKMFEVFSFNKDFVFENTQDGIHTNPTNPAKRKDCVIMQYTGLKDRNGKEVYEGDCLQNENKGEIFAMYWENNKSRFSMKDKLGLIWGIIDLSKHLEVIGNIIETPELLQEEK
ncbi:MAG: YopX family protein [Elusimicrobiota bacterium]|jgi:uncharacterized phage protein (TIGR01671 family)|nr:YopX family protein [Elusimicrobiota bacterium]